MHGGVMIHSACTLKFVEMQGSSLGVKEAAPEGGEVLREACPVKCGGSRVHLCVGSLAIAHAVKIAIGDRFEVEKTSGHPSHVLDRARDVGLGKVRQHPLADDEVEFLVR